MKNVDMEMETCHEMLFCDAGASGLPESLQLCDQRHADQEQHHGSVDNHEWRSGRSRHQVGGPSACVGRSLCAHTMCLWQGCGAQQCHAQACVSGPLALPQGAPAACRVLCAGFSLGAALATLCGPWAQATFPNVSPFPPSHSAAISLLTILPGSCRDCAECMQSCSSPCI